MITGRMADFAVMATIGPIEPTFLPARRKNATQNIRKTDSPKRIWTALTYILIFL